MIFGGPLQTIEHFAAAAMVLAAACLLVAYVLYPALMILIGWLAYRPPGQLLTDEQCPTVTLIIPAYNEEIVIAKKIENALQLDYPQEKLDVIVADDCSTDDTPAIAQRYASSHLTVLRQPIRNGKNALLNMAVSHATGEVLCLCDANVFFDQQALRRLVSTLVQNPRAGAVTGRVQLQSDASTFGLGEKFYYCIEWAIQKGESLVASLTAVDGGMYVLWRRAFASVPSAVPDDLWQSCCVLKRGKAILYQHEATAFETPTILAKDELRRRVRMMSSIVRVLQRGQLPWTNPIYFAQFLCHKLLRWLTPLWLLLFFLSTSFIAFQSALGLGSGSTFKLAITAVFGLQCGFYLSAILGAIYPPSRKSFVVCIPFYFVVANVGIAIGWWQGLAGRKSSIWERTPRMLAEPSEESR